MLLSDLKELFFIYNPLVFLRSYSCCCHLAESLWLEDKEGCRALPFIQSASCPWWWHLLCLPLAHEKAFTKGAFYRWQPDFTSVVIISVMGWPTAPVFRLATTASHLTRKEIRLTLSHPDIWRQSCNPQLEVLDLLTVHDYAKAKEEVFSEITPFLNLLQLLNVPGILNNLLLISETIWPECLLF